MIALLDEVKRTVKNIENCKSDNESAHCMEDDLYISVLGAIASGVVDSQELAIEALKARNIEYDRWYA